MEGQCVMGGEFLIDPHAYLQKETPSADLPLFSCGRAALFAILQTILVFEEGAGILVPDYLCGSITHTIDDAGMKRNFYHIGDDLLPDWDTLEPLLGTASAILLVNYFGLVDIQQLIDKVRGGRKDGRPIIILDCVQDFYGMERAKGYDYAFSSYRKWFPVPDGASIRNMTGTQIKNLSGRNDFAQYKFAGNLLKHFASVINPGIYLTLLEQGEDKLDKEYKCECSSMSRKLILALDYTSVAERRKNNARILHKKLDEWNVKHLYQEGVVPMAIPIFLEKGQRDEVRRQFFDEGIFAPVHWPWECTAVNGKNVLYDTELSLICDQRYGEEDMRRELSVLHSAIGSRGK